jgi:hypothetical protein
MKRNIFFKEAFCLKYIKVRNIALFLKKWKNMNQFIMIKEKQYQTNKDMNYLSFRKLNSLYTSTFI